MNDAIAMMEEVRKYKTDNSVSDSQLARIVGVPQGTMSRWIRGDAKPTAKSIRKLHRIRTAGALDKALMKADNKNRIPRAYRHKVKEVPMILKSRMWEVLNEYIEKMNTPQTYLEFKQCTDATIMKLYTLCQ